MIDKLNQIEEDFNPYEMNYCLSPDEIEWLINTVENQQKEIEEWKQDAEMYREYLDREKDRSELLNERSKRYEKALNDIISVPRIWEESYGQAYPTCVKIALKALIRK